MGYISVSLVESIILENGCVEDGSLVDKTVLEYIVDVLQETDDADEVRDVLEPMIEDLGCDVTRVKWVVEALIDAPKACRDEETPVGGDEPDPLKDAGLHGREPEHKDERQDHLEEDNEKKLASSSMSEDEVNAVGMLASLLSLDDGEEAQRGYLLDMYKSCGSDVDAAADVLLGKTESDIQRALEARRQRQGLENTPPSVDPDIKATIVSKYHLQAVSSRERGTSSTRQRRKENEFMMKGLLAGKQTSTVRFREGAVVTTKGEKYITEKKEEWDGGSRGRVKSKGKRGVGWA